MSAQKIQELTPKDQVIALVAEDLIDTAIAALNDKYKGLKADTKKNYELIKRGHGEYVSRRTSIEKRRLSLKRDVDAEAARLTELLASVELELKTEKDNYEEVEKARKAKIAAEKALAEKLRIDKIKAKIAGFANLAQELMSKNADILREDLNFCRACIKDDKFDYEEFINEAEKTKFETEQAISKAYEQRQALETREAEVAKQKEVLAAQQAIIDEANRIVPAKAINRIISMPMETIIYDYCGNCDEEVSIITDTNLSYPEDKITFTLTENNCYFEFDGVKEECEFLDATYPVIDDRIKDRMVTLTINNDMGSLQILESEIPAFEEKFRVNKHIGQGQITFDGGPNHPLIKTGVKSWDKYVERPDELEITIVGQNMRAHSTSQFFRHLGIALEDSTYEQAQKIKNAFPHEWCEYLEWSK